MQSHELLKDILKRTSAKQIAGDLGLSLSLIYKWAEPQPEGAGGSGANNPLDRLEKLIRSTGDKRLAQWVCESAGGFYIPNPKAVAPTGELMHVTSGIVQEFADMLSTIAAAAADQEVSDLEARQIRARWELLKSRTEGFVQAAEAGRFRELKDELKRAG